MAKPDINKQTEQVEFHIPLQEVLLAHIDEDERQEGDSWSFVDGGNHLIILRRREIIEDFRPAKEAARKAKEEAEKPSVEEPPAEDPVEEPVKADKPEKEMR